jgi:hypothetical protein
MDPGIIPQDRPTADTVYTLDFEDADAEAMLMGWLNGVRVLEEDSATRVNVTVTPYGEMVTYGRGCDVKRSEKEQSEYRDLRAVLFRRPGKGSAPQNGFSAGLNIYFDYQSRYITLLEQLEQAQRAGDAANIDALLVAEEILRQEWENVGRRAFWSGALKRYGELDWRRTGYVVSKAYAAWFEPNAGNGSRRVTFVPDFARWRDLSQWTQSIDPSSNISFKMSVQLEWRSLSSWLLFGDCWRWDLPPSDARSVTLSGAGTIRPDWTMPYVVTALHLRATPADVNLSERKVLRATLSAVALVRLPPLPSRAY